MDFSIFDQDSSYFQNKQLMQFKKFQKKTSDKNITNYIKIEKLSKSQLINKNSNLNYSNNNDYNDYTDEINLHQIKNYDNPLRFALLGSNNVGKSTFTIKVSNPFNFREVYYPTLNNNSILFNFKPSLIKSKFILNENLSDNDLNILKDLVLKNKLVKNQNFDLKLSKNILNSISKNSIISNINKDKNKNKSKNKKIFSIFKELKSKLNDNPYYDCHFINNINSNNASIEDNINIKYKDLLSILGIKDDRSLSVFEENNKLLFFSLASNPLLSSNIRRITNFTQNDYCNGLSSVVSNRTLTQFNSNLTATPSLLSSSSSSIYSEFSANSNLDLNSDKNLACIGEYNNNFNVIDDNSNNNHNPPEISPIFVELIDTPGFQPVNIIPFLELSLNTRLSENQLGNLIDGSMRTNITQQSLIIGSGLGELNGKIDGYILMYSCVPHLNNDEPPSYENVVGSESNKGNNSDKNDMANSLKALGVIRDTIVEAWIEFLVYQEKTNKIVEGDIFSLSYTLKQLWKNEQLEEHEKKMSKKLHSKYDAENLRNSPSEFEKLKDRIIRNYFLPPIMIICSNIENKKMSPVLVEEGKKIAKDWNCSFITIDSSIGYGVEEALSLMIRDSIENKKLKRGNKKH
ncbi:uncharacterized protein ASCRUDRAFT_75589 [Ascoidea rubescens DSM 1968]|uniref:Uncharacterized protein n=1 Tax=Ascoidea rubescens DSM 1968 TaxID=1344418 RepID=A0A1D2VJ00_9ASCO|nr:hypothetical protein ASCRUDRAFT_75589 [Ascoidea rubescens DSM 1968]ODV61599.1 hypothetical protein ASCRUDRAFT_75589 [Ascoidea rubescens DSM 1968]